MYVALTFLSFNVEIYFCSVTNSLLRLILAHVTLGRGDSSAPPQMPAELNTDGLPTGKRLIGAPPP